MKEEYASDSGYFLSLKSIFKTFLGLIAYSSQTVEKLENRLIAKVEACKTLSFTKKVTSFIHL